MSEHFIRIFVGLICILEKGDYTDAENDEACAKIWSIYVGEAERYDKALVEGWKADMEGMLIFVRLFLLSVVLSDRK